MLLFIVFCQQLCILYLIVQLLNHTLRHGLCIRKFLIAQLFDFFLRLNNILIPLLKQITVFYPF